MAACPCRRPDTGGGPGPHRLPGAGQECRAGAALARGGERERLGGGGRLQGGPRRLHQRRLLLRPGHRERPALPHTVEPTLAQDGLGLWLCC